MAITGESEVLPLIGAFVYYRFLNTRAGGVVGLTVVWQI